MRDLEPFGARTAAPVTNLDIRDNLDSQHQYDQVDSEEEDDLTDYEGGSLIDCNMSAIRETIDRLNKISMPLASFGDSSKADHSAKVYQGPNVFPTKPSGLKKTPPSTDRTLIPPLLSFYVNIEVLDPDYQMQKPRHSPDEHDWLPPNKKDAYKTVGEGTFFKWIGGRVVPPGSMEYTKLSESSAAIVFTQHPSTANLLAVPFDARKESVNKYHGWQAIGFDHIQVGKTKNYFSSIAFCRSESRLCAPAPSHWIPELLDLFYNHAPIDRFQVGMIGDLPLLFALAAFSTPSTTPMGPILQRCLQPGDWQPHRNSVDIRHRRKSDTCLRLLLCFLTAPDVRFRGMVVTIYLDPENPAHGSKKALQTLQDGKYGAFFGTRQVPVAASPVAYPSGSKQWPAGKLPTSEDQWPRRRFP